MKKKEHCGQTAWGIYCRVASVGMAALFVYYIFFTNDYSAGTCFSIGLESSYRITSKLETKDEVTYYISPSSMASEERPVSKEWLDKLYGHKESCDIYYKKADEAYAKASLESRLANFDKRLIKLEEKKK